MEWKDPVLPEEARNILIWLAFKCKAGRERMLANLKHTASKLPKDDPFRKQVIRDE
jgi:hypothetical protein